MQTLLTDETIVKDEPAILPHEQVEPWLISAQQAISDDLNFHDLLVSSVPGDGWGINE